MKTVDLLCRYWSGLKRTNGSAGYKELVLAPLSKPWKQILVRLVVFEFYCVFAMGCVFQRSKGVCCMLRLHSQGVVRLNHCTADTVLTDSDVV